MIKCQITDLAGHALYVYKNNRIHLAESGKNNTFGAQINK
jgi:hypothetical protein